VIGRIRGQLLAVEASIVIIDVNGVGYEVEVAESMLLGMTAAGQRIELFTHLSVREDAHSLFGFTTAAERDLFRTLIKVSGVGPRLAMALLSGMPVAEFAHCVRDNDIVRLVKLPGVGKKTAERLVVELKDRVGQWAVDGSTATDSAAAAGGRELQEARGALLALGYRASEADRALRGDFEPGTATGELIRLALRRMTVQEG
jgi:Holliday junction DNA helicase RuvA